MSSTARLTLRVLVAAGLVAPMCGQAQDVSRFPDRAPRIIVPFPPGGAADVFARLAGQKLAEIWGGRHTVVTDNRPGAGGIIGTTAAVKATPDGYTYLVVTVGHAINPVMYAKLPYDSAAELTAVGMVATVPSLVVVGPSFRGTTLKELIEAARAKPGDIQYATSGTGSTSHVGAALIESMTNVSMTHVPYKGAAAALQDVIGGRIPFSVDIITSSMSHVSAGKLRALAITSPKRSPKLPDVPTVAEAGIPGYVSVSWYLLLAPSKAPAAVLDKVNADLRTLASHPDFRAKVEDLGGETSPLTRAQAAAYLTAEFTRLGKLARERGIKVE